MDTKKHIRYLKRNGFGQLPFGDLGAIYRHSHGRTLAELARFAVVSDFDFNLHIALREWSRARDDVSLDREVIVDESRLPSRRESAVGHLRTKGRCRH